VLIWGPQSQGAYQPMVAAGNIEIGGLVLSNYDIVLVVIATAVAALPLVAEIHPLWRLLTTVISTARRRPPSESMSPLVTA